MQREQSLNCLEISWSRTIDDLPNARDDQPDAPDLDEHGGDLAAVRATFPNAPSPWIDLSTGINPWPYPIGEVSPDSWRRLPSRSDERVLCEAAAAYFGAPSPDHVVVAPGSQAIIQWLPRLRAPGRVAVVSPTYGEHARTWLRAGHRVAEVRAGNDLAANVNVLVVTRPNNPDGAIAPLAWLMSCAAQLEQRGGWLVVDEAFADPSGPSEIAAVVDRPNIVVLRSFGKFFGLAGIRIGFALTAGEIGDRLREALGPWCTSGPAIDIATRAYRDSTWIAHSRGRLERAAERLDQTANSNGLRLVGGTALFRLYQAANAHARIAALARAGIHVRRFAAHPDWLRIGLPGDARAWQRFSGALSAAQR